MNSKKEPLRTLFGLAILSVAMLAFQVVLVKFFSFKMYHHYSFILIAVSLLGLMFGGLTVFFFRNRITANQNFLQKWSLWFGATAMIAVPIFCWVPADPYYEGLRGTLSFPFYFMLLLIPFYCAGVVISYLFSESRCNVGLIYFYDLVGAAIGCLAAPFFLSYLGGYGSIIAIGWLAFIAAFLFNPGKNSVSRILRYAIPFAVLSGGLLYYPEAMKSRYGFDVRTQKNPDEHFNVWQASFGGIDQTYWNAIGRVDVSKEGDSLATVYRYGIPVKYNHLPIKGRMIFQDGAGATRQLLNTGSLEDQTWLKDTIWAAPYIVRQTPAEKSMIIGAGGGIDILVGKLFKATQIDAIEINPGTTKLLLGNPQDPMRDSYVGWLKTDNTSKVTLHNQEARHFVSTQPDDTYDVLVAGGVDTRAAIFSGGNLLAENFLYTVEALQDYYRVLKPGGYMSLGMWGDHVIRLFNTALGSLEGLGIDQPHRNIVVALSDDQVYGAVMIKKGRVEKHEVAALINWGNTKTNQAPLLYNPLYAATSNLYKDFALAGPTTTLYYSLAEKSRNDRDQVALTYRKHILPTTDDWPFFYLFDFDLKTFDGWLEALFPVKGFSTLFLVVFLLINLAIGLSLLKLKLSGDLTKKKSTLSIAKLVLFFSLSGVAFILTENILILKLSVFVGGPFYSMIIVLPSLLCGYALSGLWSANSLAKTLRSRNQIALVMTIGLVLLFLVLAKETALPMQVGFFGRMAIAFLLSFGTGLVLGLPIPWMMDQVKKDYPGAVGLMWGINSGWNVIGSLAFMPLVLVLSISNVIFVALGAYLCALFFIPLAAKQASLSFSTVPANLNRSPDLPL